MDKPTIPEDGLEEILGHLNLGMWYNEALAALRQREQKARIAGFNDARYGCSFDENCKHCKANMLTLNYLATPADLTQKEGKTE